MWIIGSIINSLLNQYVWTRSKKQTDAQERDKSRERERARERTKEKKKEKWEFRRVVWTPGNESVCVCVWVCVCVCVCVCQTERETSCSRCGSLIKANHHHVTLTSWNLINCSYKSVCVGVCTHVHTHCSEMLGYVVYGFVCVCVCVIAHSWIMCSPCVCVCVTVCLCLWHLCIHTLRIILVLLRFPLTSINSKL